MTQLRVPVSETDHVAGPADAPLTLLEYGDFQCPFCGAAYWEVRRVLRAFGDRIRFAYRHFPLAEIHPDTVAAAEASEAAAEQGLFWEMHTKLFENQEDLGLPALHSYAQALGHDMDRFRTDMRTHRFLPRVRRDFINGARAGVNGTPTFFINGWRYNGPYDAESMIIALEQVQQEESRI